MASTTFEIIRNQDKSVTPTESAQIITYDDGYDGLNSVVVGAVSSGYVGSGITRKGAQTYHVGSSVQTIASGQYLTGDQTIDAIALQSKSVTPGGTAQTVEADNGYDGLSSVAVSAITMQSKSANPSSSQQTITPDSGYSGLDSVVIAAAQLQSKNVTLSTAGQQTVSADSGYYGLGAVTVPAVKLQTKSVVLGPVNQAIMPDSGYDGLGIVNIPAVSLQNKNVTLSTSSQQTITPDSGYNGLGAVTVPAVALQSKAVNTSSSDQVIQADSGYDGLSSVTVAAVTIANLAPGAIKKGVTVTVGDANDDDRIASVTGTFGNMLESIASMEDYITCTHEAVSGTLSPGTALTIYLSYDIPVPSGSIFGRCTSWTVKTSTIGISSAYFSMYADIPPNKTSFALILVGKDGCPANTQVSIAANTIQMKMNCKTISVY